jgi:RNA polymerase sigma-70 factor (ECF subfamily)
LIRVMALDIVEDAVLSVRSVINPDKLAHLGPLLALAWRPRHSETGD